MPSNLIANTDLLQYSEWLEVRPAVGAKQTVSLIPRRSTSIEVYVDPRGNPGFNYATIRLYVRAGGVEHEAARVVLPSNASTAGVLAGPVLRYRGPGEYRIELTGGVSDGTASTYQPGVVGYEASGFDFEADNTPSLGRPMLNPEWMPSTVYTGAGYYGIQNGPMYLRQFAGQLLTSAEPIWIQFYDALPGSLVNAQVNGGLTFEMYCGQAALLSYGFDFRDVHHRAWRNDGLFFKTQMTFVFSVTQGILNLANNASQSLLTLEVRR